MHRHTNAHTQTPCVGPGFQLVSGQPVQCAMPRGTGPSWEGAPCPCSQPSPEDRLGEAANKRAIYRRRHDLTQRQRRLSLAGRGTVSSGTDIPLGLRNLPALLRMVTISSRWSDANAYPGMRSGRQTWCQRIPKMLQIFKER